ncbi:MAG: type II toxin-antitoxin system VapC family toxin [Thermoleophilia bacterium]|nr:type II toxin-antitoxin system VapC family toxin [Thermoleophilia bacterium]
MSLYLDSSALLAVYLDEEQRERCLDLLCSDSSWITSRHTQVEVRRSLARRLEPEEADGARRRSLEDWARTTIVELDDQTCETASLIAERTGARSLDALHLAAAVRVAGEELRFVTFDRRQASAARELGFAVVGA